ncbi:MAG: hypothetical protein A3I66_13465 [Burkholderiales bacterium RIFCSPLOWO2_02_FULL_57_36]|nr:MAG: hypothetical protein A3I66_13465 [Burkholderiales bacterium RIFCSPLOWO2_02_FULL_57_36]
MPKPKTTTSLLSKTKTKLAAIVSGNTQLQRLNSFIEISKETNSLVNKNAVFLSKSMRSKYVSQIRQGRWLPLEKSLMKDAVELKKYRSEVVSAREKLESFRTRIAWMSEGERLFNSTLMKRDPEHFAAIKIKLVSLLKKRGIAADRAERGINRIADPEDRSQINFREQHADLENKVANVTLSHLRRASMTDHLFAVSRFNQLIQSESLQTSTSEEAKMALTDIDIFHKTTQARVNTLIVSKSYFALAEFSRLSMASTSRVLGQKILPLLAAAYRKWQEASAPREKNSAATELLLASRQTREFLLMLSVLRHLESLSTWPAPHVEDAFDTAKKLKSGSRAKMPKPVAISSLVNEPEKFAGQQLSVKGVVTDLAIKHVGSKAISYLKLEDIQTGQKIALELHGIKIDSGGIVAGCYAQIGGTWVLTKGKSFALMIGRHPLQEYSETHLNDWLRAEISRIYQPVPHALMIESSWVPGFDGAANAVTYGVWAKGGK